MDYSPSCYRKEVAKQDRKRRSSDRFLSQFPRHDTSSTTEGSPSAGCLLFVFRTLTDMCHRSDESVSLLVTTTSYGLAFDASGWKSLADFATSRTMQSSPLRMSVYTVIHEDIDCYCLDTSTYLYIVKGFFIFNTFNEVSEWEVKIFILKAIALFLNLVVGLLALVIWRSTPV